VRGMAVGAGRVRAFVPHAAARGSRSAPPVDSGCYWVPEAGGPAAGRGRKSALEGACRAAAAYEPRCASHPPVHCGHSGLG